MKKKERKAPAGIVGGECLDKSWRTPPEIVALVAEYFGGVIPFDVCTSPDNPCNALGFWTEEDDALSKDRWPPRVFANPPYGDSMNDFLAKFEEQAKLGVEIISLPSASRFEQRQLQSAWQQANTLCLIRKRVSFLREVYHAPCVFCDKLGSVANVDIDLGEEAQQVFWPCPAGVAQGNKNLALVKKGKKVTKPVCRGWLDPYDAAKGLDRVSGNTYASLLVGYGANVPNFARVFGMAGACHAMTPISSPLAYLEKVGQRAVTRQEGEARGLLKTWEQEAREKRQGEA